MLGLGCSPNHLSATVLCDQHLAMCARLRELLLKFAKCLAEIVGLVLLIFSLRIEADRKLFLAQRTLERGAGKIVLILLHREFGFAMPLRGLVLVLRLFLFEKMLIG